MFDEQNNASTDETVEQGTGPIHSIAGIQLYKAWSIPLKRYCNHGGSLDELIQIFKRLVAESSLNDDAVGTDARMFGENPWTYVPAASSSQPSGGDHIHVAQPRHPAIVTSARPSLDVTTQGALDAKIELAASVFDTFKVRDGRMIGDVRYGELERLETADRVEAAVFAAIRKHIQAPHDAKVRHLIKPKVLATIVKRTRLAISKRAQS